MSYTKFEYSGLNVIPVENVGGQDKDRQLEGNWLAGEPGPQGVGSSTALWLHRPAYTVSFTVQNTGQVAGTEIPQVYLHFPAGAGEPPSVLRGFTDVGLRPGEGKIVNVTLSRYDLSVWDVRSQSWTRALGMYSFRLARAVGILGWRARYPFESFIRTTVFFSFLGQFIDLMRPSLGTCKIVDYASCMECSP
ncbi:fibronectin type III-like domain-containing protein [Russula vinacea]|nr:fibronectin type III-like domain-containing protein [Russula vinacea]